ncbi:hypothetical protein [Aquimarina mytili]|uniref:HTH domain-containing protein n=1 Tax=Aquimarina mytili TaxID=874423 RepID=A0A936ZXJ9_9FLAO|nr:hypothetical protein [Aquimarina mytili]MBL0684111.1 hypothetical protein [Aquimarina mytili]
MTFIRQLECIERIDQLIRLQATGPSNVLALRLGISKTTLYRILNIMKELDAPIEYNVGIQSFVYEEEVGFKFGFYTKDIQIHKIRSVA